jgi:hypothetical protein
VGLRALGGAAAAGVRTIGCAGAQVQQGRDPRRSGRLPSAPRPAGDWLACGWTGSQLISVNVRLSVLRPVVLIVAVVRSLPW